MQLTCLLLCLALLFSGRAWALENEELFARAQKAYDKRDDTALAEGLSMQALFAAIEPNVLGMNRLIGTYSRPK